MVETASSLDESYSDISPPGCQEGYFAGSRCRPSPSPVPTSTSESSQTFIVEADCQRAREIAPGERGPRFRREPQIAIVNHSITIRKRCVAFLIWD